MIRSFVVGGVFGFGLFAIARGLFPPAALLVDQLTRFHETGVRRSESAVTARTPLERFAMWLMLATTEEEQFAADAAVTDTDPLAHALDKLKAGLGGAVILAAVVVMFGFVESVALAIIVAIGGFVAFYLAPDVELRRKAAERRQQFAVTLNDFVNLVAVSVSGGGGVNTAMLDVVAIGDGWVFELLSRSIDSALLAGETPWNRFEQLGRDLDVPPLVELASSLSLASASGARITETLRARAQSGHDKALSDVRAEAERRTESMGLPVALMMLGWFAFLGYPAVAGLVGA